jgi:lysozyme
MSNLANYRVRAVKLLLEKADKSVPMLIDYHIDDWLRDLLDLPLRPDGQDPYRGWMIEPASSIEKPIKVSELGLALIRRFEGCRVKAYQCPAKVWTIGYGHTKTAKPGMQISLAEANYLLQQDVAIFEQAVSKLVTVPINQNQFDALVSFAFNVGTGALANSTLLTTLNRRNYLGAADQFLRWSKVGNTTLKGLLDRRTEERKIFLS